jgi:5-methylcytosine-specific restriction endonuclease McrA
MRSLLSSPARLTDQTSVEYLKAHLCAHGALGTYRALRAVPLTELEKFQLVPLVFGLMPSSAYTNRRPDAAIKPLIETHLTTLGLPRDQLLTDVLKSVCDQFWETRRDGSGRRLKRKYGMRDVRPMTRMYRALVDRQRSRCALCGATLTRSNETLDHIVPFRLVGDVPDGSNWQILCQACNGAKGNYVSSLQATHAYNWVYSTDTVPIATPPAETRFLIYAQAGRCTADGCAVTPTTGALFIEKIRDTGLAVADNLTVRCAAHRRVTP